MPIRKELASSCFFVFLEGELPSERVVGSHYIVEFQELHITFEIKRFSNLNLIILIWIGFALRRARTKSQLRCRIKHASFAQIKHGLSETPTYYAGEAGAGTPEWCTDATCW
ncbi:hypothetical protein EVAR_3488_1 [Eumeta japonica]|uniref:Uncharacterized protein n=1 Tax=Eumeta variegata TaxID=151549 RepID=A0A4C1SSG9_EUMVA|nr:hypothetical protein EVAR_3488_1 [Eumeta japonica]